MGPRWDAVVVGGGHNGVTAAGLSVSVPEKRQFFAAAVLKRLTTGSASPHVATHGVSFAPPPSRIHCRSPVPFDGRYLLLGHDADLIQSEIAKFSKIEGGSLLSYSFIILALISNRSSLLLPSYASWIDVESSNLSASEINVVAYCWPSQAMVSARLGRSIKRPPLGFGVKVSLVFLLGLAFVVIWWAFSSPSASVVSLERNSFGEIEAPPATTAAKKKHKETQKKTHRNKTPIPPHKDDNLKKSEDRSRKEKNKEREKVGGEIEQAVVAKNETSELVEEAEDDEKVELEGLEEVADNENMTDEDMQDDGDENTEGVGGGDEASNSKAKKKKKLGPLFDPKVRYTWKLCGQKTGQNYIPCVDMEGGHRHHKRSCPRTPLMCLVSLPKDYRSPEPWPGRDSKIWFSNLEHPKLSAFIKTQNWLNLSGDYLLIPPKASEFKGGAEQYVSSIEEMVPDIEWGKNIRVILDIGCTGGGFGVALLEKNVITLSFGLMGDQTDLAQLTLERGIPAVLGNLASRRLPFPSSVFDAIHCGECGIPWHSSGGKLLLEMNRILRPGGYFITSTKNGDIDSEEGSRIEFPSVGTIGYRAIAFLISAIEGGKMYSFPKPKKICIDGRCSGQYTVDGQATDQRTCYIRYCSELEKIKEDLYPWGSSEVSLMLTKSP
ncbi:hypothetical protein ZIOFF_035010 [Zingiber officinale]|uniref:Methyltransferase n=1 Tax=Zingiber officinale TaxID=94328 RepID=A0A8J5GE54_ZINOF|nr:hypothetical protein ZIOFF_035010 [Zingiber officinale]